MALSKTSTGMDERLKWIAERLATTGYFQRADLCAGMECDMSTASFAIREYSERNLRPYIGRRMARLEDGEFVKAGWKNGGSLWLVNEETVTAP